MDHVRLAVIVVLCVTPSGTFIVPPGVELSCPPRCRVKVFDKDIEFEVSDNKTECDRLAGKDLKDVKSDMWHSVDPVFIDGQYRAKISWDYVLSGNRLPRVFLINLSFYDINPDLDRPEYLSDSCIVLRLIGNRKIKLPTTAPATAKFHFDCLPLLDVDNIGLVVKLWTYKRRQGRRCRSLRSLPEEKGPCGTDVHCSKDSSYPISKNYHPYRQCACYVKHHGYPELHWNYTDKKFEINLKNVPPYLDHATIDIVNERNGSVTFTEINVNHTVLRNSEINITSDEVQLGLNTVTVCNVTLYMECKNPGKSESEYQQETDDMCEYKDFYYVRYPSKTFTVLSKRSNDEKKPKEDDIETILGIVGAVAFVVIVTTVIFVVCQCLKRNENRSTNKNSQRSNGHAAPLGNGTNNTEFLDRNPENQSLMEQTNIEQMQPERIETNFTNNHPERGLVSAHTQPGAYQCAEKRHAESVFISNKHQVMLLYHHDANNQEHNDRVDIFSQILASEYGISLKSTATENWQDFAESAFVKFQNVVLVVSEGLVELCHQYSIHSKHLLVTQEIIPCIALEKMRNLTEQDLRPTDVTIHIVALNNQRESLQKFFKDHQFLTQENSFVYDFCGKDINSLDLTSLVERLKPLAEKQIPDHFQQQMMQFNLNS